MTKTNPTELVERLQNRLAMATQGEWQMQDGSSWRRIGTRSYDGDVLCPTVHPRDGHPDLIADNGKLYANLMLIVEAVNALPDLLATITRLTSENERLRALLIDPGEPAWGDARGVLEWELRKLGMDTHADNVAAAHPVLIPSHVALNLIAHAARSTLEPQP